MNLYEKAFNEDVKNKKKAATGVHSRTGKRGYTGKILFPSDYLTGTNKKEYQGTSEVRISSMYDQIVSYEKFKKFSEEEKKKYLTEYCNRFTGKEICEAFNIPSSTLYYLKRRYIHDIKQDKSKNKDTPITEKNTETIDPVFNADGLSLSLGGKYNGSDLITRFEKLSLLLNEDDIYTVRIELMETKK